MDTSESAISFGGSYSTPPYLRFQAMNASLYMIVKQHAIRKPMLECLLLSHTVINATGNYRPKRTCFCAPSNGGTQALRWRKSALSNRVHATEGYQRKVTGHTHRFKQQTGARIILDARDVLSRSSRWEVNLLD